MNGAPELTPDQAKAVYAGDIDVSVRAGAGSGKTRVLVHRAAHLVTRSEDPLPLRTILAITFTEKAAREMKERLADVLSAAGRTDARADVETAYVSTIHGFCARLVRENAVEARVDPAFGVLDEFGAIRLRTEALRRTALRWVGGGDHEADDHESGDHENGQQKDWEREDGLARFARIALTAPEDEVVDLYESLRGDGIAPTDLVVADGEEGAVRGVLTALIDALRAVADAAPGFLAGGLSEGGVTVARAVAGHLPRAVALAAEDPGSRGFAEIHEFADSLTGAARLSVPKDLKALLTPIRRELLPSLTAAAATAAAIPALLALRDFLVDLDAEYRRRKREAGVLDFSDLEGTAFRLLSTRPDVRETVRGRFRQILVDEYQDVNRVQERIIGLIRGEGNHFAVGDVKQSIYGFRYADPALFKSYTDSVPDDGRVVLAGNFRSRPGLVSFTNRVFARIFADDPLVDWSDMRASASFAPSSGPPVEVLLTEGEDTNDYREREARMIADLLRRTVEEDRLQLGGGDPVRYGDIALLFRALTDVKLYERAFEERGVPYYVVKGRGFYQAREVVDLIRLLSCVRNPRDEVALASALRSPFAGVSEDALVALKAAARNQKGARKQNDVGKQKGGRLSDLLRAPDRVPGLADEDRARFVGFALLLRRLRRLAGGGSLRELVETAFDESGYATAVWGMPGGPRRAANMKKTIALADAFLTAPDLSEFLDALHDFRLRELKETEAPTGGEAEDVVKLLTIHAAKGLEFPVVVLPDLTRRGPGGNVPGVLYGADGLAARISDPPGSKPVPTGLYLDLKKERLRREADEARRLLYVAVTRAEEHLILCARDGPDGAPRGSFWSELTPLIDLSAEDGDAVRIHPEPSPVEKRGRPLLFAHMREIAAARPIPGAESPEGTERAESLLALADAPRPAADGTAFENTVSELLVYAECPRRHHFRYELGIPEERTGSPAYEGWDREGRSRMEGEEGAPVDGAPAERGGLDELPARDAGIAVHEVLRFFDPHSGESAEAEAARRIRALFGDPPPDSMGESRGRLVEDVARMAAAFYDHPVGREVLAADPREVRREAPFLVRWRDPGLILRGKIDLVYRRPDGTVRIVDYKTGTPPPEGSPTPRPYRVQLVAYAASIREFVEGEVEADLVYLGAGGDVRVVGVQTDETALEETRELARKFAKAMERRESGSRGEEADCARCSYRGFCPVKKQGRAVQGELFPGMGG